MRVRRLAFAGLVSAFTAGLALRAGFSPLARRGIDRRSAATILVAMCLSAFVAAVFLPDPADGTSERPTALVLRVEEPEPPMPMKAPKEAEPALRLPPPPEAWHAVRKPIAIYHLESAETDRLGFRLGVETRGRHDRRDTLTWVTRGEGAPEPGRATIQIAVERFEAGAPTARPLFPDLAQRMASEGHAIERMNAPGQIATKFGAMEVADAILELGGTRGACLLFRRIDGIGLTIAGWYCGTPRRPVDRISLGCFIDRLDLVAAGRDIELKRHFAAAERNRSGCGQGRLGARKQSWLDHEAPIPALKLSQRPK